MSHSAGIEPSGPGAFLVIVPAYNEEGAIAQVVESVHTHVPGAPVMVIEIGRASCRERG